jgi:hypothetical protein
VEKRALLNELLAMSDGSGSQLKFFAYFSLRRPLVAVGLFLYCLALFLAFDFAYSTLTRGEETKRNPRIANAIYDHGFAADFDGYDVWGELRYRLITNSLGLKDAAV